MATLGIANYIVRAIIFCDAMMFKYTSIVWRIACVVYEPDYPSYHANVSHNYPRLKIIVFSELLLCIHFLMVWVLGWDMGLQCIS